MRRILVLVLALAASACGPSMAEVRRARAVGYDAPFPVVWNVMTDEIHKRYHQFREEDPVKGRVASDWRMIEAKESGEVVKTDNTSAEIQVVEAGVFMRTELTVSGGPPWFIKVKSEAAEFNPSFVQFMPIKPGSKNEPAYVRERTDRLLVDIYRRLAKYAVEPKQIAESVHKRVYDDKPWANVPAGAAALIIDVRKAADGKDTAALRQTMDPTFTWSRGAPPSADTAVTMWGADPSLMRLIVTTLDKGCGADEAGLTVTCPAGASLESAGPTLGMKKSADGVWRFAWFLAQ